MIDSVIDIRDAHKSFKAKKVLKGVNLQISRGSVLGLLGKNAAGKTTLIKCLLGILTIKSGRITVLAEDTWTLSAEAKSRIGYVPQKLELYGWMSIRQIIDYTAAFYPRWNHDLSNRLLGELELNTTDKVANLSGGQAQSVGLILALGHEPELVVLDEPAASLDPATRRRFLALVLEIVKDQNRTILFSTHLTGDLERVADSVAILKDGVIDYAGRLDDLKDVVKKLKVLARRPLPGDLDVPGLLHVERHDGEALLSVRGVTARMVKELEARWDATIEIHDLNLEDIFVEVHRA